MYSIWMYNKAGVSSPIYFWAAGTVGQWGLRRVRAKTGKTFIIFQPHSLVGVLNMQDGTAGTGTRQRLSVNPSCHPYNSLIFGMTASQRRCRTRRGMRGGDGGLVCQQHKLTCYHCSGLVPTHIFYNQLSIVLSSDTLPRPALRLRLVTPTVCPAGSHQGSVSRLSWYFYITICILKHTHLEY